MKKLGGRPMVMGVFALLVVPAMGFASQERTNVTIEQRAQGSDVVVHGKVKEKRFEKLRNAQGDELIVTHVNLEVQESLKGAASSTVDMVIEGGTYEGMTLKVSDQPELATGEEVVAFLNKTEEGFRPNRRGLGILRFKPGTHQVANSSLDLDTIRQKTRNAQQSR